MHHICIGQTRRDHVTNSLLCVLLQMIQYTSISGQKHPSNMLFLNDVIKHIENKHERVLSEANNAEKGGTAAVAE